MGLTSTSASWSTNDKEINDIKDKVVVPLTNEPWGLPTAEEHVRLHQEQEGILVAPQEGGSQAHQSLVCCQKLQGKRGDHQMLGQACEATPKKRR